MSEVLVVKQPIPEDHDPWFMARVVNGLGVALTRADVNANGVYLRVFDLSANDPNTVVATQSSLDPSTAYRSYNLMDDTLQTTGWHKDNIGRNFMHVPSISILDSTAAYGGRTLRWEYEFSLAMGGIAQAVFETKIVPRKSG